MEEFILHKMPHTINDARSRLPTAPAEEQHPNQKINSILCNAVISKKKNTTLFLDSLIRRIKIK